MEPSGKTAPEPDSQTAPERDSQTAPKTIHSLEALCGALRAKLPQQSNFYVVNTRLIMLTGVNLKKIRPEQSQDPQILRKVQEALAKMGLTFDGAPQ